MDVHALGAGSGQQSDVADAPPRRRRRRSAKRRRNRALTVLTYIVAASAAIAGSGGIVALIDGQTGGRVRAIGAPVGDLYQELFGGRHAVDGADAAAFCRIDDPGTVSLGSLAHACMIGDPHTVTLAELTHPTMCTIGDADTLDFGHLAAGGPGVDAPGSDLAQSDPDATTDGAPTDLPNAFASIDPHGGRNFDRGDGTGRSGGSHGEPSEPDAPNSPDPPSGIPQITPTGGPVPHFKQNFTPPTGSGDPGDPGLTPTSFDPGPGGTPFSPFDPISNPTGGGNPDPGGGNPDPGGGKPTNTDPPDTRPKRFVSPVVAVPEPGTLTSFSVALLGLLALRRRIKRA